MLSEKLRRIAEEPQKEHLKLEIHHLIMKAEYSTTVLGNHVSNFIPHADQPNRFSSPTYKNHLICPTTSHKLVPSDRILHLNTLK